MDHAATSHTYLVHWDRTMMYFDITLPHFYLDFQQVFLWWKAFCQVFGRAYTYGINMSLFAYRGVSSKADIFLPLFLINCVLHLCSLSKYHKQAVREAATICPTYCKLTFDLESGVQVRCACDMGYYLCANFSLPRPLCSRFRPDVHNSQTSDVQHRLIPHTLGAGA